MNTPRTEIFFEVHEAEEGGYWARALGESIFTQGKTWDELRHNIREAVGCHFDESRPKPPIIRFTSSATRSFHIDEISRKLSRAREFPGRK
jgi:predicted RNase H-like HicB family nuclease